jgi:hypothetical protein
MELRRIRITSLILVPKGTSMSADALKKRVKLHLNEICADIPKLKSLSTSEVELGQTHSSTGLTLDFFLVEIPQLSLPYPRGVNKNGNPTDMFLQDVKAVREHQISISGKFHLVLGPQTNPLDDRFVQRIRRRIKRMKSGGILVIPSGPVSMVLNVPVTPMVLPLAVPVSVHVVVKCIFPNKAEIETVESTALQGEFARQIAPRTKFLLKRVGIHSGPASGQRLQLAMDNKTTLVLNVLVALDWVTGQPKYLELIEFSDAKVHKNEDYCI